MTYTELKPIIKSKRHQITQVAEQIGYTREGLQYALNNETIELRKLKKLCELLGIKPKAFFEK